MSQVTSYKSCFQIVKTVLDELYKEMPQRDIYFKDNSIKRELASLRGIYPSLREGNSIDYSSSTTRFAYVYRYVVSHANVVYRIIEASQDLRDLFESNEVYISCLGGGPGTELLGISKYVTIKNKSTVLKCDIYDKQEHWRYIWYSFCFELKRSLFIVPLFQSVNVLDSLEWMNYVDFARTNLFTMSYFLSELYCRKQEARQFLFNIFDKAQAESLFLCVDNKQKNIIEWFDKVVKEYNDLSNDSCLRVLRKENIYTFELAADEQPIDMEPYYSKFDLAEDNAERLRRSACVNYRIYRKQ